MSPPGCKRFSTMSELSNAADGGKSLPSAPVTLLRFAQFVAWKLIQKPGRPKPDKVPIDPKTGMSASVDKPATWGTWTDAVEAYQRGGCNGIGFVLTAHDPFVCVDLDDCADPGNGTWKPHAQGLMARLQGAWETSQSGKGLHGIGHVSDKPRLGGKRRKFNDANGNQYECYTSGRFIAFGHMGWCGEPVVDWTDTLASWLPNAEQESDFAPVSWIDQPRAGYDGHSDDDELIRGALASKAPLASLGRAPTFAELWNADPVALGRYFPDQGDRAFDHSSADLALMNALAWWTGCNPVRMERLFNQSALSRGDQRKTRLAIAKAIADPNRSFFSRAQRLRDDQRIGDDTSFGVLPTILTLDEALAEFVFIGDGSNIVSRSTKTVRKYADANHEFAASKHPVDTGKIDNEGRPVIKHVPVMRLWLENPSRLGADTITWAPDEPEFCRSPERLQSGDRAYNLWIQPTMLEAPGNWQEWVKPFLQHVEYLVPVEAERTRFLQWVAHIFQKPGDLPHTCYLMIATQTGIGRGTFASILTRALRGYVAANMNVDALFGGFNGRISQKLVATVDEVREGNSVNRYAKSESLKSKITEETRSLNPKYGAQSVEKNCCRWLMFSNHLDALPFDNSDRRIIVIENPAWRQNPDWYTYLHGIMNETSFIASVQKYFMTLDISGFNPHEPAPINDAKRKALIALESEVTRACRDFVNQWPGELSTVSDLREFVGDDAPASRALHHEIERAGMLTAGKVRVADKSETVLIVRGGITGDNVRAASKSEIVRRIMAARFAFRATGG